MIIGQDMHSLRRESLYTGCVSANKRFFNNGEITENNMKAAETDAALILFPQSSGFLQKYWSEAIGCAGTIKAIADIVHEQGWCLNGISYQSLQQLRKALIDAGHIDKVELRGLSDNRKPVIAGGLSILLAVFSTLKIEQMRVSDQGMREGLLYDLVGRITHQDVRDATVDSAMAKWGVDIEQAKRVANTADQLHDQICKHWFSGLNQMKPLLKWAAMLHEIGLQVSHNNYHKHGSYLLTNADMQGFSRQEQALLAALVLSHRSKLRTSVFKELMTPYIKTSTHLCVLLRISVLLHRGRSKQAIPNIDIKVKEKEIKLQFPQGWLDSHSMTLADLIKEINHLDSAGYQLSFE
jgi:exopolyphosphatase/guanosine-5'-triphosphate,3'-diphosphate pyrophosphatase